MKNTLELLFGAKDRWRLIKMFLFNEETVFSASEISARNKIDSAKIKPLLEQLIKAEFLIQETDKNSTDKTKDKKNYTLNKQFPFLTELKNLVIKSNIFPQCESLEKIKTLGKVKLVIICGTFLGDQKAKADILIVGDELSKSKTKSFIDALELETGKAINYCVMDNQEFRYRVNMFDRFITEIIESPHEILLGKTEKDLDRLKSSRRNKLVPPMIAA